MSRILLSFRLAGKDIRRRPAEAALLLLAIVAAAATLSLALSLHGVAGQPYSQTRAATAGPDVVVSYSPPPGAGSGAIQSDADSLIHAPGVTGHSGPYPVAYVALSAGGIKATAEAEGRSPAMASVDQPKVTDGSWITKGGVVVERSFAEALGVTVGDKISLGGRAFSVVGIAVTAAFPEFPELCQMGCSGGPSIYHDRQVSLRDTGLVWLSEAAARDLGTPESPLNYSLNLRLANPAEAPAFVNAYDNNQNSAGNMTSWQSLRDIDALLVSDGKQVLLVGSFLLGLLALASLAVMAGGRMAEQTRRVGLLKAVGGTPRLVTGVLLTEYVAVALIAAAIGLFVGWLAAPLLTGPGAGLVGTPGAASLSASTVELVVAAAIGVALLATLVPALRAARTSTVRALADSSRAPRRRGSVIKLSAHLPVPLLIGLRLASRRPRRAVLSALSIAITVTMLVAVLAFHATAGEQRFGGTSGIRDPVVVRDTQVLVVISVMLIVLAAVNAIFITWSTVLDARHSSAVTRALGATPQQVSAGLSAAQVCSAVPGAIAGIPLGIELFTAASRANILTVPPTAWLVAVVLGTVVAVAGLTTIPARIGARRAVAEVLQCELA